MANDEVHPPGAGAELPPEPPQPPASAPPPPPSGGGGQFGAGSSTGGEQPGKAQAIAIMLLCGGAWGIAVSIFWFWNGFWGGVFTCGLGCIIVIPGIYSLVMGILTLIKGSRLLGAKAGQEAAPRNEAILQILNIIAFDPVNVVLGILTLIFLNEPEVKAFYRA